MLNFCGGHNPASISFTTFHNVYGSASIISYLVTLLVTHIIMFWLLFSFLSDLIYYFLVLSNNYLLILCVCVCCFECVVSFFDLL